MDGIERTHSGGPCQCVGDRGRCEGSMEIGHAPLLELGLNGREKEMGESGTWRVCEAREEVPDLVAWRYHCCPCFMGI